MSKTQETTKTQAEEDVNSELQGSAEDAEPGTESTDNNNARDTEVYNIAT